MGTCDGDMYITQSKSRIQRQSDTNINQSTKFPQVVPILKIYRKFIFAAPVHDTQSTINLKVLSNAVSWSICRPKVIVTYLVAKDQKIEQELHCTPAIFFDEHAMSSNHECPLSFKKK